MIPAPGATLLHYRLVEPIGAGGMGVVWRALDTTLSREVAIKVLPDVFSGDPERLARFNREAKLLASLNHPNVAAIYGLHEADGLRFLAMELVSGEDLAAHIARGPMRVAETVTIARKIAEGLEAAHESGVIHRDLKPANVRLTEDGSVKILDFGLAKAFESASSSGPTASALPPTVTSAGSAVGVILGTAAYMAPEQARGKAVDRRADVWSFGCVLYEMLTGVRPFDGETVSDSIAKILQTMPDLGLLPAGTPARVRELIARCLEKDPRRRLRDIGDARLVLEDAERGTPEPIPRATAAVGPVRRAAWIPWVLAAVAVLVAAAASLWPRPAAEHGSHHARFLALNAPEGLRFQDHPANQVLSPDGRSLVVVGLKDDGVPRLYLRAFADPKWRDLPGTEGSYFPFWSADGRYVGFFAGNKLKKIAIAGGTPDTICDAAAGRGGTWNKDGIIVFAPGASGPLMQVRADGGTATPATTLDAKRGEVGHRFPRFLPDGRRFLYATIPLKDGGHESWIQTLGSDKRDFVINSDGVPTFVPPDRLVYRRNKTLFVQPFDPATGKLSGEPRSLVEAGLPSGFMASPTSSAGSGGELSFTPPLEDRTDLVWFDMDGVQRGTVPLSPARFEDLRVSPDGSRALVSRYDRENPQASGSDIWLVDLVHGNGTRVTFDPQFEICPAWLPGGREFLYSSNRSGPYRIYRKSAEGAGNAEPISEPRGLVQMVDDVTPDGRDVVVETQEPATGMDLWTLEVGSGKPPTPFLDTPANEDQARLSPDGRWIAYLSDETGRQELYVQSFPEPGSKVQVSNGGADRPAWSRDGRRLFFLAPDRSLMAAEVAVNGGFRVGAPARLFRFPRAVAAYDVAPDGKRILASMDASDAAGRSIGIILDWR